VIKFNRSPKTIDKNSGIPIFDFQPKNLNEFSIDDAAKIHDNALKWLFDSHYQTEEGFRQELVNKTKIEKGDKVLITAAGSANDVKYIAKKVGTEGEIFIQDYAQEMLIAGYYRCMKDEDLKKYKLNFFVNDALKLPFDDNVFDVSFHFGGINLYNDIKKGIYEMHRVTKKGGQVLLGDEGLAHWLKETEEGKAQITNNKLYRYEPPLRLLPNDVENVNLSWVINNCYYVITYTKAKKSWHYNMDLQHKGVRGGSVRTRHFGKLEGIEPDLKKKFYEKILQSGKSRVQVLEDLVTKFLKDD
jgi:ubiquinone/menaquinone biosynthesis C-methylase UbiE